MDALATAVGELTQLRGELQMLVGSDGPSTPYVSTLRAILDHTQSLVEAGAPASVFDVVEPERRHCVIPALLETSAALSSTFGQATAAEDSASAFLSALFGITG